MGTWKVNFLAITFWTYWIDIVSLTSAARLLEKGICLLYAGVPHRERPQASVEILTRSKLTVVQLKFFRALSVDSVILLGDFSIHVGKDGDTTRGSLRRTACQNRNLYLTSVQSMGCP